MKEYRNPVRKVIKSRSRDIISEYKRSRLPDSWWVPRSFYKTTEGRESTGVQLYSALREYLKYNRITNIKVSLSGDEVFLYTLDK